jgi:WG containing repeat
MMFRARTSLFILYLLLVGASAAGQSADDRYPFVRDGKVGFIDYQGREVIPPRFSNAGGFAKFDNGLAPVFEAGRGSGYIDKDGKFVIGPTQTWGWGRPFHEDIAGVLIWNNTGGQNRAGWIDRQGKIVFSGLGVEGTYFSEGLMSMPGPNGKWGFVDNNFQFVIEPRFDYAYEFSEGRGEVTINHKSGFIDKPGKIVVPLKYDMVWPFQDGLARVRRDIEIGTWMTMEGEQPDYRYQYGFIDHEGNEVIPLQFEEATYFSDGYALVIPSNFKLYGIIDKRGRFVHEPEFDEAEEFHEGRARVCVKQKCGFVDTSGKWIVPPTLISASDFWHGLAIVTWKEGEYGYIDKKRQACLEEYRNKLAEHIQI